jgi:PAS domain S-box-containing protein
VPFPRGDGTEGVADVEVVAHRAPNGAQLGYVQVVRDVTDRVRAEAAQRVSDAQFRAMFESAAVGVSVVDAVTRRFVRVNDALVRMLGHAPDALAALTVDEVTHPDDRAASAALHDELLAGRRASYAHEKRYLRADGGVLWARAAVSLVPGAAEAPGGAPGARYLLGMIEDVTERKRVEAALADREAELQQAQKMEAVGRLAGGIAHDFNNLLAAIASYAELLLEELPDPGAAAGADGRDAAAPAVAVPAGALAGAREDAREIRRAAERGATLTRQLLAFGRRQQMQPRPIDLHAVIADLGRLLGRVLGASVALRLGLADGPACVVADPGQLEQVLLNLAVNARDAMPEGGVLTIGTSRVDHAPAGARRGPRGRRAAGGARAGALRVRDGVGHRRGDGRGHAGARVRAVLHHQAGGARHRASACRWCTASWRRAAGRSPSRARRGAGRASPSTSPRWRRARRPRRRRRRSRTSGAHTPPARARLRGRPARPAGAPAAGDTVVLVVDDDAAVRTAAARVLARRAYTVLAAGDGLGGARIRRAATLGRSPARHRRAHARHGRARAGAAVRCCAPARACCS